MRTLFIAFFCLSSSLILGQASFFDQYEVVYFETGSSEIPEKQKLKVIHLSDSLLNSPELYTFSLSGFTDKRGSVEDNRLLSLKRANAVKSILIEKGFIADQITCIGNGIASTYFSNGQLDPLAKNRRVEIRVALHDKRSKQIGRYKNETQFFTVDASKQVTLKYKRGTKITVQPNTFMTQSGRLVKGNVELQYKEYREPLDFVLGNIPMSFNQNGEMVHFSSSGMFEIRAYANGKELKVKKGKSIQVDFKTTTLNDDWDFYQFNENHHSWEETSTSPSNQTFDTPSGSLTPSQMMERNKLCAGTECERYIALIELGKKYTSNSLNLSKRISSLEILDSIYPLYFPIESKYKEQKDLEKEYTNQYVIKQASLQEIPKQKAKNFYFKIKGKNQENNDISPIENVVWVYQAKKNTELLESLQKLKWNAITIDTLEVNKSYKIRLVSQVKRYNLEVKPLTIASEKTPLDEYMASKMYAFDSLRNVYRNIKTEIKDKKDSIARILLPMQSVMKRHNRFLGQPWYYNPRRELKELQCFWSLNKPFMFEEERILSISKWYDLLFRNQPKFKKRYLQLEKKTAYSSCLKEVRDAQEAINKIKRIENQIQSFFITSGGIYNCDIIKKIINPVLVSPEYLVEDGTKINIYLIYLLDESINGAIRYDGYMNFGPYQFKVSSFSKTNLIAFDKEGIAYMAKNDQLKSLAQKETNSITLVPIKESDSKHTIMKKVN